MKIVILSRLRREIRGFLPTFSRHAKAQTGLALAIWLNENVQINTNQTTLFLKDLKRFVRFLSQGDTHYHIFRTPETYIHQSYFPVKGYSYTC